MNKGISFLLSILVTILFSNILMFGQETTGSIEITIKDTAGAVVPNATVTITNSSKSSTTGGFKRTINTDTNGFQRVLQIPPGTYSVTVDAISGFTGKTVDGVQVILGRSTPVNVELGTQVGAVVDVSTETSPIDTTDSKIQTNITAQTAELLPKGTNFSSLLKISPAVRPELGGFQIDGSSGSENTFIIDGHEVTNARTGVLNENSNLPFSLVQEVQIKSSGFEAEYGGATGGVVNLVTKSGGNDFHGEIGTSFTPSKLQATGSGTLFLNAAGTTEYIPNRRDSSLGNFPSVSLGGPIIKNRLWFFGAYSPQYFNTTRTINYYDDVPGRPFRTSQTYTASQKDEYASGRLDAQPFDKLHLTGKFIWSPTSVRGAVPAYSSLFDLLPTNGTLTGAPYYSQLGGRQNSSDSSGEAVWTPFSNLILSVRGGHSFLNEKLGTYGLPDVTATPRILCSAGSPSVPPASFGCIRGQSNGVDFFSNTVYDATRRDTIDTDATFLTSFGGRHEIKGGYQWNRIKNNLLSQQNDYILLRFGQTLSAMSGRNVDSAPGAIGAGFVQVYGESGNVSGINKGIFIQDKWQPINRLTLNVGVRAESETIPSFTPGLTGLKFGWGSKITPRIGVAYDLFGDGKTKISGFYGQFNDRFKYELPRGSFGGAYYHTLYFDILPTDAPFTSYTASKILGGYNYVPGGKCPQTGTIGGRVRCDVDSRIPSNAGLGLEFGAIDPDIKPMRTTEITFTAEHQLSRDYFISGRYSRKKLDRAIEDIGFLTSAGSEAYVIGNPGLGLAAKVAQDNGLLPLKAERNYDAIEVRLDKRLSNNFGFNANYTYSRLIGNYSGLASTDEGGRNSPNVNRYFDLPFYGYTVAGGPDNGKLATDRPHAFKFSGSYRLDWNDRFGFGGSNSTDFKLFTTVQSGTPLTSVVDVIGIATVTLNNRGDLGRSPIYSSTDFGFTHRYRFGRDSRFQIAGDLDILNLFNEHNVLGVYNLVSQDNFDLTDPAFGLVTPAESLQDNAYSLAIGRFQRNGAPVLLNLIKSNSSSVNFDKRFGLPNSFQAPRSIRFGFRFLF